MADEESAAHATSAASEGRGGVEETLPSVDVEDGPWSEEEAADAEVPPMKNTMKEDDKDEDVFLDSDAGNLSLSLVQVEVEGMGVEVQVDMAQPIGNSNTIDDGNDVEKQAAETTFIGIDDTFADDTVATFEANGSFQSTTASDDAGRDKQGSGRQRKVQIALGVGVALSLLFVVAGAIFVAAGNGGRAEGADSIATMAEPSHAPSNNPTASPTPAPSASPSASPTPNPTPFLPFAFGDELYTTDNNLNLQVSVGLSVRLIAVTGRNVRYGNGDVSNLRYHGLMDGAGIVSRPDGGYVYVSNSEVEDGEGGVYALYFDSAGDVTHYKALLTGTSMNCGGGLTPWNTWISCEEVESVGQCYQIDPNRKSEHHFKPQRTLLGGSGGKYESVAVDDRNPDKPIFFVTEDHEEGALRRFEADGSGWESLHRGGTTTYLRFLDDQTFEWTTSEREGRKSAEEYYNNSEGISYHDGYLYFVAKYAKRLFILDLDNMTYESERTGGPNHWGRGNFNAQPDQLAFGMNKRYLYLTEDGGSSPGAFVRDLDGTYYTILRGVPGGRYDGDETVGIALTPDRKTMYVGMQRAGMLFAVSRDDGHAFE